MTKKNTKVDPKYYDSVELEKEFDFDRAEIVLPRLRKININVTEQQVTLAEKLASITGNGYQNMIKTAISIGLKSLEDNILKKS
jgi:predicted DNA binding CopG/RHH family protein